MPETYPPHLATQLNCQSFPARVLPTSAALTVYVVDNDGAARKNLCTLLEQQGHIVEDFPDSATFLAAFRAKREACLVVDAHLPDISGLEVLLTIKEMGYHLPVIMISGCGSVRLAVQAMKAGAVDFIEKPVSPTDLIASIDRALSLSREAKRSFESQANAAAHIDGLTPRQHQVMEKVLAGHPSKNIAADLHISQRTVENHRASIMRKTRVKSLPALARLAMAAVGTRVTA